jgi:hypothetical protein
MGFENSAFCYLLKCCETDASETSDNWLLQARRGRGLHGVSIVPGVDVQKSFPNGAGWVGSYILVLLVSANRIGENHFGSPVEIAMFSV